jgi:hypothetical protein
MQDDESGHRRLQRSDKLILSDIARQYRTNSRAQRRGCRS